MKNRKSKTPTLSDRLANAEAALISGVTMFDEAALRLDAAQAAHAEVVADVNDEIARLSLVAAHSQAQADRAGRTAEKIRDLTA